MSNGFLVNPINPISLDTHLNNWLHERLQQAFESSLPLKLSKRDIKPLRVIGGEMEDNTPVLKLIELIKTHGEIEIKRDSGWGW